MVTDNLLDKIKIYQNIFNNLDDVNKEGYYKLFGVEFTHNSTVIEGNTFTLTETRILLKDHIIAGAGKSIREVNEILGHEMAFDKMLEYSFNKTAISEDVIFDLHTKVMYPASFTNSYRNVDVFIYGSKTKTSEATHVYQDMKFLISDLTKIPFKDPIEKAAYLHAEFVKIHPFTDGNGRTARLIMALSLLNDDYPMIYISKEHRGEYISALEEYGVNKNLQPLKNFLAQEMLKQISFFIEQYQDYIK